MDISRIESIRQGILDCLAGNFPLWRDADTILREAHRTNELQDVKPAEVDRQCAYFVGMKWIEEEPNPITGARKRWKMTTEGLQYMERQGLI